MADVTLRYGPDRKAEPLSDWDRDRLRQLAGKARRSPQEQYELGALRGRARHDPAGRRLLDDVNHDQAARTTAPVTVRQAGTAIAQAVADAIARRRAEEED